MSGIKSMIDTFLMRHSIKEGRWVVHVNELFQISGLKVEVNTN